LSLPEFIDPTYLVRKLESFELRLGLLTGTASDVTVESGRALVVPGVSQLAVYSSVTVYGELVALGDVVVV